ncbi:hypothetical protein ACFVUS_28095 [Nocardia sp. NPDC058058]|uniref:hypothetical protein n=1 Tax=Nocardia sp. NPDC058058 TaxID=3346317 RepID=UPI0036DC855E
MTGLSGIKELGLLLSGEFAGRDVLGLVSVEELGGAARSEISRRAVDVHPAAGKELIRGDAGRILGGMPLGRRMVGVVAGLIGVAILVGLGIYLARIGLDDADKVASVIGAFCGLISVGIALVAFFPRPSTPAPSSGGNTIMGTVHGHVVQADTIDGDIDLR